MNDEINFIGGVKLPDHLRRKYAKQKINILNDDVSFAYFLQEELGEMSPPYLSRIFTHGASLELNGPQAEILLIDMTMVHHAGHEPCIHTNMMFWIKLVTERHGYKDIVITSGLTEWLPPVAKDLQNYLGEAARVHYLGTGSSFVANLQKLLASIK